MSLNKILIVPDSHFPFVNQKAFDLMLKAAKDWKPDTVVVLGDFWDFFQVSSHLKDPERKIHLKEEIQSGLDGLKMLESLRAKRHIFIEGNHERRLILYLQKLRQKNELEILFESGILSKRTLQDFFGTLGKKWEWVPYRQSIKIGKLNFTHDLGQAGWTAVSAAENSYQESICIGHVHSMQSIVKSNLRGKTHVAASLGWLGSVEAADYLHTAVTARNWSHGFGIAYHDTETDYTYLTPVPIVADFNRQDAIKGYSCLVEGKLYSVDK